MLRRLGIRGKVLAALSVPVIVLFALAGTLSWQSLRDVQVANTVSDLLVVLQESRSVTTALQAERKISAEVANPAIATSQEQMEDVRRIADESMDRFRRAVQRVDLSSVEDTRIPGLINGVVGNWDSLSTIRERVDRGGAPVASILNNYSDTITQTIDFPAAVAGELPDRDLARIISAHRDVRNLQELYHFEQVYGQFMLAGQRSPTQINALIPLLANSPTVHARTTVTVLDLNLGENVRVPALGSSWDGTTTYDGFRTLIKTGSAVNFQNITWQAWTDAAAAEIVALDPVQEQLRQAANTQASATSGAAIRTLIVTSAVALAAIIASVLVALSIARQIVTPLRRLTAAAGSVREELPRLVQQVAIPGQGPDLSLTQIPVTSRDEIGRLAQAFNDVNLTTISVAQEQAALRGSIAEMFVNVARRDQILLNRQLSFIDALERTEEDPRVLADLFRIDHLATRMRRNSESLLVLAGIDSGRRVRETLPISDVIRTASSEIEHYERIQLDLPIDPTMLGHTVLPAAHLVAELLENATEFSEPGTPVHVMTGMDEDAVIVEILDDGLGMSPAELAEANEKISVASAGEVLGSQRLGLHVVGRLATRLGAEVVLSAGPNGRGTVASVRFPLVLFIDTAHLPRVRPTLMEGAQGFLLPEEVTGAAVQDVAQGALGSFQNPAAEVDLEALTDGATDLGLPRRRSHDAVEEQRSYRDQDDAAAASSIPLAPRVEDLLDAAGETVETWQPPLVIESTPLVTRHQPDGSIPVPGFTPTGPGESATPAAEAPSAGGLPTRRSATPEPGNGLPSRPTTASQPAISSSGLPTRGAAMPRREPAAPAVAGPSGPAAPVPAEGRAAMVSGFRSRRAELAAASLHVETGEPGTPAVTPGVTVDPAERLAAAAFFSQQPTEDAGPADPAPPAEPTQPAFVVPSLVDDDDQPWAPTPAPVAEEAQPWAPSPWASLPSRGAVPEPAPAEPAPAPAYEQPVPAPAYEQPAPAPAYEQPAPVEFAQPIAWGADAVMARSAPTPFEQLVQGSDEPKARRGFFGRRRKSAPAPAPVPVAPAAPSPMPTPLPPPAAVLPSAPAPAPAPAAPARASAFDRPQEPPVRTGRHRAVTPVDLTRAQAEAEAQAQAEAQALAQAQAQAQAQASRPPASVAAPVAYQPPVAPPAPAPSPMSSWMPAVSSTPAEGWPSQPPAAAAPYPPDHVTGPDLPPVPAQHGPLGTPTFTPQMPVRGSLDEEVTSMLAQRADIAQQALAELSQFSSYRPQRDTDGASKLIRRTPGTIPAAPEIERKAEGAAPARDANQVRSVLANFQSGSHRGRAAGGTPNGVAETDQRQDGLAPAGTAPETDPNPGSTSW